MRRKLKFFETNLQMSFIFRTFAAQNESFAVFSHAEEYVISARGNTDILKKASYALCFGDSESGKFTVPKQCSTRCPMVCIIKVRICVHIYAYSVGFSVVVWNKRQYQSLESRNSNSAVPLFCCIINRNT